MILYKIDTVCFTCSSFIYYITILSICSLRNISRSVEHVLRGFLHFWTKVEQIADFLYYFRETGSIVYYKFHQQQNKAVGDSPQLGLPQLFCSFKSGRIRLVQIKFQIAVEQKKDGIPAVGFGLSSLTSICRKFKHLILFLGNPSLYNFFLPCM